MPRHTLHVTVALAALVLPLRGQPPPPPPDAPPPPQGTAEGPGDAAPPADAPIPPSRADQAAPGGLPGAGGPLGLGGLPGFAGPGGGPQSPGITYLSTWLPERGVAGQAAHLGFVRQDLSAGGLLWSDGGSFLIGRAGVRSETFQTDAILPDSHRPFPDQLWNVNFGLTGLHSFDNGWSAGGGVSAGSASDRPFADIHALNVGLNAFLRMPSGDHDSWLFSLAYSPLGQLPFPIPGVAYVWNPSERFAANIGVPLRVVYRPTDDWILDASYMLLTTVRARATYRLGRGASLYGGFDWSNESYYLSQDGLAPAEQSGNSFQRFFYYEKRLTGGLHWAVTQAVWLDLSAGYAFDRYYLRGSAFGGSSQDRVDVGDGPFVAGQVRLRW